MKLSPAFRSLHFDSYTGSLYIHIYTLPLSSIFCTDFAMLTVHCFCSIALPNKNRAQFLHIQLPSSTFSSQKEFSWLRLTFLSYFLVIFIVIKMHTRNVAVQLRLTVPKSTVTHTTMVTSSQIIFTYPPYTQTWMLASFPPTCICHNSNSVKATRV